MEFSALFLQSLGGLKGRGHPGSPPATRRLFSNRRPAMKNRIDWSAGRKSASSESRSSRRRSATEEILKAQLKPIRPCWKTFTDRAQSWSQFVMGPDQATSVRAIYSGKEALMSTPQHAAQPHRHPLPSSSWPESIHSACLSPVPNYLWRLSASALRTARSWPNAYKQFSPYASGTEKHYMHQ